MKKLLLIALLIIGCDNSNGLSSESEQLVGIWEMAEVKQTTGTEVEITMSDENYNEILTFNSDGTYTDVMEESGNISTTTANWELIGANQLQVTHSNGNIVIMNFCINETTLILYSTSSNNPDISYEVTYYKQ